MDELLFLGVSFVVWVGMAMLMLGLRRIAWRYAFVTASGMGLVFVLLRGWPGMSTQVAVLLAAIGGGLATLAAERGERDRKRRVAQILEGSSNPR
jgi:hypothetical protein